MWKVSQIICFGALAGMSVTDVMFRKVPRELLILGGIGAVLYQCIFRDMDIWLLLGGAGVGCVFLLLSKVTEEGIGYGDSWGILVLGLYMGMWKVLGLLAGAFTLLLPAGLLLFMTGKLKRKSNNHQFYT